MEENNHIYPIFDKMLMRKDKEDLLKQHSVMVWCGEYPAYSRSFQTLS